MKYQFLLFRQIVDTPSCRFSTNMKVFFQRISCPHRKTFKVSKLITLTSFLSILIKYLYWFYTKTLYPFNIAKVKAHKSCLFTYQFCHLHISSRFILPCTCTFQNRRSVYLIRSARETQFLGTIQRTKSFGWNLKLKLKVIKSSNKEMWKRLFLQIFGFNLNAILKCQEFFFYFCCFAS